MNRGFKVCSIRNRELWSFLIDSVSFNQSLVQYIRGLPTRPCPGCGPLTVFSTMRDAVVWLYKHALINVTYGYPHGGRRHRRRDHLCVIWCEYKPSLERSLWAVGSSRLDIAECPLGTVLADEVTPRNCISVGRYLRKGKGVSWRPSCCVVSPKKGSKQDGDDPT